MSRKFEFKEVLSCVILMWWQSSKAENVTTLKTDFQPAHSSPFTTLHAEIQSTPSNSLNQTSATTSFDSTPISTIHPGNQTIAVNFVDSTIVAVHQIGNRTIVATNHHTLISQSTTAPPAVQNCSGLAYPKVHPFVSDIRWSLNEEVNFKVIGMLFGKFDFRCNRCAAGRRRSLQCNATASQFKSSLLREQNWFFA